MNNPEMSKYSLSYKNGYALSYVECGDRDGFPIFVQHGLIASITDCSLFKSLIEMGTRVISMARPGYGASSPYVMKNMAEWGEIVSELVEDLQLSQFDVLGISSGAPYSYSIGYRFPNQVRNIFILSGTPALYNEEVLSFWPYPVSKSASMVEMQKLAYELFFSNLSPVDLEKDDIRDSMRNDCFGVAQDLKIRCLDWGFSLGDVKPNVIMRHSRADTSVPLSTAELTARMLPNCTLDIRQDDVHFSVEVLDDFIRTVMAEWYVSVG